MLFGEWRLDELWWHHPFSGHCHLSRRHFHEKFLPWWPTIVSSRLEILRSREEIDTTMTQHKWPHLRFHRCSHHPRFDKLQLGAVFKPNLLISTQLSLHNSWLLHYFTPRTIFFDSFYFHEHFEEITSKSFFKFEIYIGMDECKLKVFFIFQAVDWLSISLMAFCKNWSLQRSYAEVMNVRYILLYRVQRESKVTSKEAEIKWSTKRVLWGLLEYQKQLSSSDFCYLLRNHDSCSSHK